MRKTFTVVIAILLLLAAFSQLIIPGLVQQTMATRIKDATQAESVSVKVDTVPGAMLLAGQLDKVNIEAHKAVIGQIRVEKLTLLGENVRCDMSALDSRDGSAVQSADKLELTGIITQEALQELLVRKLEKLDNIQTTMDREKLTATGEFKLLGRTAQVNLEGIVFAENGGVYFHMTHLDIRNAVLGKAVIGNFFGDILLFDLQSMPVKAEVDYIEQAEGQVIIHASQHRSEI